jgi:hypothetical protein
MRLAVLEGSLEIGPMIASVIAEMGDLLCLVLYEGTMGAR